MKELTPGEDYVLLRYEDYKSLPKDHVYKDKAAHSIKFTAQSEEFVHEDIVNSHSMAFYRCIEAEDLEWYVTFIH